MTFGVVLNNDSVLQQLLYVSDNTRAVSSALQAEDILIVARQNNARDGITGALAFTGGNFVQILEGVPVRLDDLLARLARDDRHHNLKVLARRTVETRDFLGWAMVSPRLAPSELDQMTTLLDRSDVGIEAYIDIMAQAVARQSDVLAQYGFVPTGTIAASSPRS